MDNGAQGLCFEIIPWERVLGGHGSHGGDGGGIRVRLLEGPPAVSIYRSSSKRIRQVTNVVWYFASTVMGTGR